MKTILLITLTIASSFQAYSQQKISTRERMEILSTVKNLFEGTDERNWEKVRKTMADEVVLDYSSLSGVPESKMNANDIVESWKKVLPGFDKTHHEISKFQLTGKDGIIRVHYFGKADHYLGDQTWTVDGTYDTVLEKRKEDWVITKLKLTVNQQRGDLTLPAKALEIAKTRY